MIRMPAARPAKLSQESAGGLALRIAHQQSADS